MVIQKSVKNSQVEPCLRRSGTVTSLSKARGKTYQSFQSIRTIRMMQIDFGIVSASIYCMLAGHADVGIFKVPRYRVSSGEIDSWLHAAYRRLVDSQNMWQDLKIHLVETTIAADIVHAMAIKACFCTGNVSWQINGRLEPLAAGSRFQYCRWRLAAVEAFIRRCGIRQPRVKIFPVGRPSGLCQERTQYKMNEQQRHESVRRQVKIKVQWQ